MPQRLPESEIDARMVGLPHWERRAQRLHRSYRFADFSEAFGWMTRVALVAESLNHHPEWRNVYARVEVELTTHDAGGLTALDFELAHAMDRLAGGRGSIAR